MSGKKNLEEQVIAEQAGVEQATRDAETIYSAVNRHLSTLETHQVDSAEQRYAATVRQINADHQRAIQSATNIVRSTVRTAGAAVAPWNAAVWAAHDPPSSGGPPLVVRVGELAPSHLHAQLPSMPALLSFADQKHAMLVIQGDQSRAATTILENIAWRIAALGAPGTSRFMLLDLLDRGNNLASLLALPEAIRGERIHCEDDDVERTLRRVTAEIEDINQKRLGHTYQNIEAYNAANPRTAIPYTFVVFVGFPHGFTPKAAALLASIARTGPRTGRYLLGAVIPTARQVHDFDLPGFLKLATCVQVKSGGLVEWNDPDFARVPFRPDAPPSTTLVNRLAVDVKEALDTSTSSDVPFQSIALPPARWWRASSVDGLRVPLGVAESGDVYEFEIGRALVHHGLIGGTPGSGKSTALHVLITMLCTHYSPQDLELYLVDFKDGVEFQDYATYSLPHARAVVLEAEREFGLSVLKRLTDEMEQRAQLFKDAHAPDLRTYRETTGRRMPRIVLIVDEYVVLFPTQTDDISQQAAEALAALVMRGRSYGIHVLLSAQRPASSFLTMGSVKNLMELRMALKCRPEDSTVILGDGNTRAASLINRGEAYITTNPDDINASERVRISLLEPKERAAYLERVRKIHDFYSQKNGWPEPSTIVFSRDAPAMWSRNRSVRQRFSEPKSKANGACVWLGQPISIDEDIFVPISPSPRSNLLLMGSDVALAGRLLLSALLSLSITVDKNGAEVLFVSPTDPDDPVMKVVGALGNIAGYPVRILERQGAVDALAELNDDLVQRLTSPATSAPKRTFFLVNGLHRWAEVRSANPYGPNPIGDQIMQLLRRGPEYGIHTLLWSDRLSGLAAVVGNAAVSEALAQFGHRVSLQMSADESMQLLGTNAASRLGAERAYYRSEQWSGDRREKFKPYALPTIADMNEVLERVKVSWRIEGEE